jgi:tetratricopeptide (TPR) repeat protein
MSEQKENGNALEFGNEADSTLPGTDPVNPITPVNGIDQSAYPVNLSEDSKQEEPTDRESQNPPEAQDAQEDQTAPEENQQDDQGVQQDQDTQEEQEAQEDQEGICKSCGSTSVVEGYSIPLCKECREKYARRPIPAAIKIFASIIIAILIFSLVSFPKSLNAGIAFERGQRAENAKKYATAAKEYEKVVEIFPNSFIAAGKLFIAYVENQQFEKAEEAFSRIAGKESSDSVETKIIDQANAAIAVLDKYSSTSQDLIDILKTENATLPALEEKLKQYTLKAPSDFFGHYYLAEILFELGNYEAAKSSYLTAVELSPDFDFLRLGAAAAYRQTGEYDKAVAQCNAILEKNQESSDAYASLCKIDLKRHQYEEALESAKKACFYDEENSNAFSALVLSYHFNGMTAERDANLAVLKKMDEYYYKYAAEIINGQSNLFD